MQDAQTAEAPPAIEVRGETRCPRPEEVSAALGRMLGPSSSSAPADVVELREDADWLVVVVRRASGEVVGEKRLPVALTCVVRAETAAVAIAALEGRLSAGGTEPLALPPRAAPLEPPPSAPEPRPPAEALPPPVAETPPVADALARLAPTARAARVERWVVSPGAAILVSLNGSDAAPAARLEVTVGRASGHTSLGLAGVVVGAHSATVLPGEAAWRRWGAELDLRRQEGLGRGATFEVRLGAALAALTVGGHSFPRNADATLFDPGFVAGLRLTPFAWGVRPWLDVSAALWPRTHDLSVMGGTAKAALPQGEAFLGVGASFGGNR